MLLLLLVLLRAQVTWELSHAPVEVRPCPALGDDAKGVYATSCIECGKFLGNYEGEVLDYDQLRLRHPTLEPAYAFRIDDDRYVDAVNSTHWTRFMNHNVSSQ